MVIQQIQNKGETFFSVCIDYNIFIIQEKYYDSFLTTLKSNLSITKNPRVVDLSNKTKYSHPFFENTSFNPRQYSHIHTEITNFSQSLQLKKRKIWPFIEEVLIGFIICQGYEHSYDAYKHAFKEKHKIFNESDLIFLRSLKSNGHSNEINRTDLYYYLKDQSIYVIKTWNNNNQDSLKKYEKEKAVYESILNDCYFLPHCFGHAAFQLPIPNLVINFIQGENLHSILTNPNKSQSLSKQNKFSIILSIMVCFECLHFNGYVYRDLKFDNIIIRFHHGFAFAILVDFDACCELPSKKCEPIDKHPKYFFKEEIDSVNDIITVLKIDRETNAETFVKTISLTHHSTNSPLEMSTETYVLMNDIGSNYFSSPEQRTTNKYTYASDIYSLGKFMYYLCIGEIPNEQTGKHIKFPPEYSFLEKLYSKCTRENPSERPNISRVINKFYKLENSFYPDLKPGKHTFSIDDFHLYSTRVRLLPLMFLSNFSFDAHALNMIYTMLMFVLTNYCRFSQIQCAIMHFSDHRCRKNRMNISEKILDVIGTCNIMILLSLLTNSSYYHFEQNILDGRTLGNLGSYFISDFCVLPNLSLGFTFLIEGALRNDSLSLKSLASAFLLGESPFSENFKYALYPILEKSERRGSRKITTLFGLLHLFSTWSQDSISRGIGLLCKSANEYNCPLAQLYLGRYHLELTQNVNRAVYYLKQSNCAEAKYMLCKIYFLDLNNPIEGLHYLQLAALDGESNAQFDLSNVYLKQQLTSEALENLTLASKGNSLASFILFCLYTAGILPQNGFEESLKYLLSSIKQENPIAIMIYTQLIENNATPFPDLNQYIKSISSGCKSLSYFAELIDSCKIVFDNSQVIDSFFSIFFDWYFYNLDYDEACEKIIDYCEVINDKIQYKPSILFEKAIFDAMNGNVKAVIFLFKFNQKIRLPFIKHLLPKLISAAEDNNSDAQLLLAKLLIDNEEFCDIPKGIYYLKAAASNNNTEALERLADYYSSGEMKEYGIPEDQEKAMDLLILFGLKGSTWPLLTMSIWMVSVGNAYYWIDPAFQLAKEAIRKGCLSAYFPLGLYYFKMMNYVDDSLYQTGLECFNLAEKHGDPLCKLWLAMIYDGLLPLKDEEKAFRLYSELLNAPYMKYIHNNLGVILKNGNRSVPKNIPLAIEYFETAIKQYNDIFALLNLSRMYFYGEGVPINIDKATTLLSQLDTSNSDVNKLLDYLGQHPTKSAQISNETLNNLDMTHILPRSWQHLFPPNCLDSIDFIYKFDEFLPINGLSETIISKQLKSTPITTAFYEGLT